MFTKAAERLGRRVARGAAAPVLVFRNPSATVSVWAAGRGEWHLVVGNELEVSFRFGERAAAEAAAGWLAYRDLSGLLRPDITWHGLVDAIHDRDPSRAATAPASRIQAATVERRRPEWMEQRRQEYTRREDTPSARVQAERVARRQHHEAIAAHAVEEWRGKASLAERLTEQDGPELAEFFLRCLAADAALRADTLEVLAELESAAGDPS